MKFDYHSFVGKDFMIVRPVYEDIVNEKAFEQGYNPKWNVVGSIIHITSYETEDSGLKGCFHFEYNGDRYPEVLFIYDFENGFLEPLEEYPESQIDDKAIINIM